MLTLEKARKMQREAEGKVILKFLVPTVIIAVASYLLFFYTDMLSRSTVYYLVPIVAIGVAAKFSGLTELFSAKEFIGEVIKIDIYNASDKTTKRGGFDALQNKWLEAEIIIKDENGKTKLRVFRNGDTTSRLSEGDRVAFMRFITEPVVIKGKYWNIK